MLSTSHFPVAEYLDLAHAQHPILFAQSVNAWDALDQIAAYLKFRLQPAFRGERMGHPYIGPEVYVGEGTTVEHGAVLKGPAWIGDHCHIRSGAYIRENVIIGNHAVIGNSCEIKSAIILDHAQIPHFNYVGDSILGYKAHLGAGVILSNVRLDRSEIKVRKSDGTLIPTGRRKFGAIIGDHAEIGCNTVISPGSLVGRHALIHPGLHWNGVLPARAAVRSTRAYEIILPDATK